MADYSQDKVHAPFSTTQSLHTVNITYSAHPAYLRACITGDFERYKAERRTYEPEPQVKKPRVDEQPIHLMSTDDLAKHVAENRTRLIKVKDEPEKPEQRKKYERVCPKYINLLANGKYKDNLGSEKKALIRWYAMKIEIARRAKDTKKGIK